MRSNLESLFIENNTNAIDLFENQIEKYESMRSNDTEINERIDALILKTNQFIDDYIEYSSSRQTTRGRSSFTVSLVIAAFNLLGYDLAAELLTHALDNEILDSFYKPVLGTDVLCSSVFNAIRDGSSNAGSNSFPNSGSTDEKDLYYAIHSFYYRKSTSGRVVIIQDRYDYQQGAMGGGLVGDLVNAMYEAQEEGILIPYYTYIVIDTDKTATNQSETVSISTITNKRYYESHVVLGKDEIKEFSVTFSTSGKKMLQTFGTVDAKIELYDAYNNSLVTPSSIDDAGYGLNSMVIYNFQSCVTYKARVQLYNNSIKSGEFKLIITPAMYMYLIGSGYSELTTYESIWAVTNSNHYTLNTSTLLDNTKVLTFTPSSSGEYVFETECNYNTYIYVLDPRSFKTFSPIDGSTNNVDKLDDNSGSGNNAKVTINLEEGIPYLIIYSLYNIGNTNEIGSMKLHIDKS